MRNIGKKSWIEFEQARNEYYEKHWLLFIRILFCSVDRNVYIVNEWQVLIRRATSYCYLVVYIQDANQVNPFSP